MFNLGTLHRRFPKVENGLRQINAYRLLRNDGHEAAREQLLQRISKLSEIT